MGSPPMRSIPPTRRLSSGALGCPTSPRRWCLAATAYLDGEGGITIELFACSGSPTSMATNLRAAGLMRYLNEMLWFPAAYLGDNVTITAIDDDSFGVRIVDRGLIAEAILDVDAAGRPTNFRAIRYNTGTGSMEAWETPITAWSRMAGLELPSGARPTGSWAEATCATSSSRSPPSPTTTRPPTAAGGGTSIPRSARPRRRCRR